MAERHDIDEVRPRSRLAARARRAALWAGLVVLSAATAAVLRLVGAPAALMLGPLLTAIGLAQLGQPPNLPRALVIAAQALLGCRLAMEITPALVDASLAFLPVTAAFIVTVLIGTMAIAIAAGRSAWLPGNVALFGLSPGAAAAMVLMSEAYGADPRLVATMQYLRVLAAALVAIAVGAILGAAGPPSANGATAGLREWFTPLSYVAFGEALVLALLGAVAGWALKKPLAVFFVPMIGGGLLQVSGLGRIELPDFLLAAAFAIIGWNIGLKFTRATLVTSWRLLPRIAALVVAMLGLCAALSTVLMLVFDTDPLSAYLALSPGGLDSVLIIASTSEVDMALVLGAQVTRLVIVISAAPVLAQLIARRSGSGEPRA